MGEMLGWSEARRESEVLAYRTRVMEHRVPA
jgi:hypothetical protein